MNQEQNQEFSDISMLGTGAYFYYDSLRNTKCGKMAF